MWPHSWLYLSLSTLSVSIHLLPRPLPIIASTSMISNSTALQIPFPSCNPESPSYHSIPLSSYFPKAMCQSWCVLSSFPQNRLQDWILPFIQAQALASFLKSLPLSQCPANSQILLALPLQNLPKCFLPKGRPSCAHLQLQVEQAETGLRKGSSFPKYLPLKLRIPHHQLITVCKAPPSPTALF